MFVRCFVNFTLYLYGVKRVFSFIFLLLFLSASLHQATLLGVYLLNQDFITETFCVNKDKPELSCNGKCHLKDMVAMAEDDKAGDSQLGIEFTMLPVFFEKTEAYMPKPSFNSVKTSYVIQVLFASYHHGAFHPPEIA